MRYRALGKTEIMVSPLGLGTVKFGRNTGVKYPQGFEMPDEKHLSSLLALAQDLGVNLIDTAPAYGLSEERLGRLLKGQRQNWVIVGKAGEEFKDEQSTYIFTPEHFEKSLERSLKRLQTDYLDVFLIHSDGQDEKILSDDALIQTLKNFKKRGLVKAIGASTKTREGGQKTLELMDVVMATYNQDYTEEKPVLEYAAQSGQGVLLKKVLGSGHSQNPVDALNFALKHPGVTSAIIGTISPDHLKSNVKAVENL